MTRPLVSFRRSFSVVAVVALVTVTLSGPVSAGSYVTTLGQWITIANEGSMMGLAVAPSGNLLSYSTSNNLYSFSPAQLSAAMNGSPVNPLPSPLASESNHVGWVAGIAVTSGGTIYFNAGGGNTIWQINPTTHAVTPLAIPSNPFSDVSGMLLSTDQSTLYVADQTAGRIYQLNLATLQTRLVFESNTSQYSLEQMVMDASGNLFVSDLNGYIYEIAAPYLSGVGAPATVGSGASVVAQYAGGANDSPNGLAIDPSGNLFVATCSNSAAEIGVVTHSTVTGAVATGAAATIANGGIVPIANATNEPSFGCMQPLAVSNGVLYAGDWNNEKVWGLPLSALGTLISSAPIAPAAVTLTRTSTSLSATWHPSAGAVSYTCTLMYGFNEPSSFKITSSTTSCWFGGLSPSTSFGLRVVANGVGGTSPSVVGFAAAPPMSTITCVRGHAVRHVRAYDPRCPAGFRLKG